MAVVCSNPQIPRNGDLFYPYRQHSDFFYLTGIFQEGSTLVLSPEREILFIRKPDPKTNLWSGPLLSREQTSFFSAISEVRWMEELDGFLKEEIPRFKGIMLNHDHRNAGSNDPCIPGARMVDWMEAQFPGLKRSSLSPLLTQLRMLKEPEEVEEIKKACTVTRSAFLRVMRSLRPGMREFEVEAEITAEFIRNGARGHAFEPIIASGANALTLHYVENSGTCREGDLLLMDFGAEVNNYAADCSRTIPVGGRFSKRQRQLYESVYRVFIQARSLMVPGITLPDLHEQVGGLWEEEHIALGLYTRRESVSRAGNGPLWKNYFMHGTSHSMGLDVHDTFDRSATIREGMVLTCEPAIYIQEEEIGIRLENDILITSGGPVDLMEDIPMEADEIEYLLCEK